MNNLDDSKHTDDGNDPLDQLLREACWSEPSSAAESRLSQRWNAAWTARTRRRTLLRRAAGLAIAASLLAGVAVVWRQLPFFGAGRIAPEQQAGRPTEKGPAALGPKSSATKEPSSSQMAFKPVQPQRIAEKSVAPLRARGVPSPEIAAERGTDTSPPTKLSDSRPPDRLEELILASAERRWLRERQKAAEKEQPHQPPRETLTSGGRKPNSTTPPKEPVPAKPEKTKVSIAARAPKQAKAVAAHWRSTPPVARVRVERAIKQLALNPKGSAAAAAGPLQAAPDACETELVHWLDSPVRAERIAAVRLLGEIESENAVALLLRTGLDQNLHAPAIDALVRIADAPTLATLAAHESDAILKRSLIVGLLRRGDVPSVRSYLLLVENSETAVAALAAAEHVDALPMDLFFAALQSSSVSDRIAAARVIGRIDGPAATERLIGMIQDGISRQEACIALLTSRGSEAVRYVANARRDPVLASLFQAASDLCISTERSFDPSSRS